MSVSYKKNLSKIMEGLLVGSSIFFIFLIGCSRGKDRDSSVLLTVNGEDVRISDVEEVISDVYPWKHPSDDYKHSFLWDTAKSKLRRKVIDAVVERKLLLQEARKRKIKVTKNEVAEELKKIKSGTSRDVFSKLFWRYGKDPARWMKHLKEEIMIRKLLQGYVYRGVTVSEDEIRRYYSKHITEFSEKKWVKVHMIMFDSLEDALKFRRSASSVNDFLKYEQEKNMYIPGEGFIFFGDDVSPYLWKILNSITINKPSKVFNLRNGYYVFLVTSRGDGYPGGKKEIWEKIYEIILAKKQRDAYVKFLADLKKKAKIKINVK